jgi:phosphoribosylformimino-5-aminoimidazole carboxamide ribotide isomerase
MALHLIPAIDLKDGQCVRLRQGDLTDATIFSDDPGEMARQWITQGAAGDIPVQVGGGIRDLETIERMLDDGVSYAVIGTAAVKNPGLLKDACAAFMGHIIVSIDAKDGRVATDGWSKLSGHEVIDLARKFEDDGVEAILYTDIGRDGMLTGVNLEATVKLAQSVKIPVIASGGIAGLADIEALCAVEAEGVMGAILGRALYEGRLDFAQAQALADKFQA